MSIRQRQRLRLRLRTLTVGFLLTLVVSVSVFSRPARLSFDTSRFVPVDTRRLLGSPDPLPPLEVVRAFPNLKFSRPVHITHAGDGSGRLFVCDQIGVVYAFPNRPDVAKATVFLDLREKVLAQHFEEGLLGLAFHPRYKENREFFIYYSTRPRRSIVARYRTSPDDPNRALPDSEEVLLTIRQPFGNHNGGSVEFGPDGMLYIGLGDGGKRDDPFGNGQNLKTLLGSILRIDVGRKDAGRAYAIPADNPFAGKGDSARGEIWAYGIRNPWKLTFDSLTGEGWIADVGQDKWEEVNILVKGGNYGWKVREGRRDLFPEAASTGAPFVEPIWEYPRQEGKSVTGGVVYRGKQLPELFGAYLYGDFVTFNIWALRYDGKQATSNHLIARSRLPVTAFGEDAEGEVYIAALEARPGVDVKALNTSKVFHLTSGGLYRLRRREGAQVDTAAFPRRLSQTKLFADLKTMRPAPGLIPYSINVPLWSDGAGKTRYLALPAKGKVGFSEKGDWRFPTGTVLVKTFTLPRAGGEAEHRLETRLLVRSERGWDGYTYLWDDERMDAQLLDAALRRPYAVKRGGRKTEHEWYFPSRSDCNACHTKVAGFVLGLNTRQLNRWHDYGAGRENQLEVLNRLGVFSRELPEDPEDLEAYPRWGHPSAPVDRLARAYLDVNCATCHAPGGTGLAKADLRYHTPLEQAFIVNQEPGQGRVGGPDTRVVVPGAPHRSELLLRMMQRGQGQMPTLASDLVDWEAVQVLGEWIESLSETRL